MNFDALNFLEYEMIVITESMLIGFRMMNMVTLWVSKDDSNSDFEEIGISLIHVTT